MKQSIMDTIELGICSYLLFPQAMTDEYSQHAAITRTAILKNYTVLDAFLSTDKSLRKSEISLIKAEGKKLNYNLPGIIQFDNEYNAASTNEKYRRNAVNFIKMHTDFAFEADCSLMVVTSCLDQPGNARPAAIERFFDYICSIVEYANKAKIQVCIEPIERGCFKNLLFGPTADCVSLAKRVQAAGFQNFGVMLDTAHLPTLNETFEHAMNCYTDCGIKHVHLGNCVLKNKNHRYYGHQHAPMGIMDGEFDVDDLTQHIKGLIDCGYIDTNCRCNATISFETQVYPGVSAETTAQVTYEKFIRALELATVSAV